MHLNCKWQPHHDLSCKNLLLLIGKEWVITEVCICICSFEQPPFHHHISRWLASSYTCRCTYIDNYRTWDGRISSWTDEFCHVFRSSHGLRNLAGQSSKSEVFTGELKRDIESQMVIKIWKAFWLKMRSWRKVIITPLLTHMHWWCMYVPAGYKNWIRYTYICS